MLLRARSHPRTEHWARGVSGGSGDEFVSAFTKCTISTKGDGLKADVQALLGVCSLCTCTVLRSSSSRGRLMVNKRFSEKRLL